MKVRLQELVVMSAKGPSRNNERGYFCRRPIEPFVEHRQKRCLLSPARSKTFAFQAELL